MKKHQKHPFQRNFFITSLICLAFFVFSFFIAIHLLQENEQKNYQYLHMVFDGNRASLSRQIRSNFQTLEGLAAFISREQIHDSQRIQEILSAINDGNSFIRIGLADKDGLVTFPDADGRSYPPVNLSQREFFQRALKGEKCLSATERDPLSSANINYYAVPVIRQEKLLGILCAANPSAFFLDAVDVSALTEAGYSRIIDSTGKIVIYPERNAPDSDLSALDQLGLSGEDQRKEFYGALSSGQSASFHYYADQKQKGRLAVLAPLDVNDWFILSVIPDSALKSGSRRMVMIALTALAAVCLYFPFLLNRQNQIVNKSRQDLLETAYRDPLAGCANYAKFLLEAESKISALGGRPYALWYCDLKQFKYFNYLFGYETGDRLLIGMARILERSCVDKGPFGRISADNFVGLCTYEHKEELSLWFTALLASLEALDLDPACKPYLELCVGFYCPEDEETETLPLKDMVNRANMARKSIKNKSGSQLAFFSNENQQQILWESEISALGKSALKNHEFLLYFQPKVNIQYGGIITGVEVLARWHNPRHGIISPGKFIPYFENSGLIVELDRYMFEKSCQWLSAYLNSGRPRLSLAINVSRLGLLQDDFVEYYSSVKEKYGIPDCLLELEFTESVILNDDGMFHDTVIRLQKNGFICALDDFGAGYSSLNMLKKLPIDVLKLDILFFKKDVEITRERIVISHILAMAKELNIRTIAEGVETVEQVHFLRSAGCDVVQGYVFSRPIPQEYFDQLISTLNGAALLPQDL